MNGPIDEYAVTLVDRLRKARERGADEVEACKRVLGELVKSEMAWSSIAEKEAERAREAHIAADVQAIEMVGRVDGGTIGALRRILSSYRAHNDVAVIVVGPCGDTPASAVDVGARSVAFRIDTVGTPGFEGIEWALFVEVGAQMTRGDDAKD